MLEGIKCLPDLRCNIMNVTSFLSTSDHLWYCNRARRTHNSSVGMNDVHLNDVHERSSKYNELWTELQAVQKMNENWTEVHIYGNFWTFTKVLFFLGGSQPATQFLGAVMEMMSLSVVNTIKKIPFWQSILLNPDKKKGSISNFNTGQGVFNYVAQLSINTFGSLNFYFRPNIYYKSF